MTVQPDPTDFVLVFAAPAEDIEQQGDGDRTFPFGNDDDSSSSTPRAALVSVQALQSRFSTLALSVNVILDGFTKQLEQKEREEIPSKSGWKLTEIEISVGIDAKGNLGFLGLASSEIGGNAAFKLKLERSS